MTLLLQPVIGSHVSTVHSLPSSQSAALVQQPAVGTVARRPPWQTAVLQASPPPQVLPHPRSGSGRWRSRARPCHRASGGPGPRSRPPWSPWPRRGRTRPGRASRRRRPRQAPAAGHAGRRRRKAVSRDDRADCGEHARGGTRTGLAQMGARRHGTSGGGGPQASAPCPLRRHRRGPPRRAIAHAAPEATRDREPLPLGVPIRQLLAPSVSRYSNHASVRRWLDFHSGYPRAPSNGPGACD